MAISVTLNTITSGYNLSKINANFTAISAALQDALSRTGTSPNTMSADIDMNNNDLINVASIDADSYTIGGATFNLTIANAAALQTTVQGYATAANNSAIAAANSATLAATFNPALYLLKTGGTLTGGLVGTTASFSGAVTASGQAVWHAGNLTPGNYALLSGATFSGAVITSSTFTANGAVNLNALVTFADPTTTTKKFNFNAASITAATTRTITVPDRDITLGSQLVVNTSVATTSGTAIDVTSIPSWVKRITIMFNGVSTSGTSLKQIQLGTSGGVQTTGYDAMWSFITAGTGTANAGAVSSGFVMAANSATDIIKGSIVLTLENAATGLWSASGTQQQTGGTAYQMFVSGDKTLTGTLDRIRLTTINGTDTFDAGSIVVAWE